MYNHVVEFMNINNIIDKYQFGFRQRHSTQQAIITLVNKITSSIDSGDLMIGVFLDLKKAFDTLTHSILIRNTNTKYEIVYFKNMIKNKWQKNDNNQNKVNMFMLIRRLQNSNN